MASEQRDPLDHLLDGALATYSRQEPRPGLERRVLSRIHVEGARPRLFFLRWALPVAAVACLLAGIALWNRPTPAPAPWVPVRNEATPPAAIAAIPSGAKRLRRQPTNGRRAAPKRTEFPVREALTHEERALVAFVRRTPDEAQRAFGETQPVQIEPLHIDEIQLRPLEINDDTQ
jgi:hypothetical protein